MQKHTTIALFGALVLSVGILGAYGFASGSSLLNAQSATQTTGNVPMLGHVTLTVTDPQGNILAYHQGDNVVVNQAEDCLSQKVFGIPSHLCPSGGAVYNVIALGNYTGINIAGKTNSTLAAEEHVAQGLGRQTANTQTETDATTLLPVSDVLQAQFTNGGTANTVDEAGLFNSTTYNSVGMFARQTFTGITLNNGDSLTVKWTVTMGT